MIDQVDAEGNPVPYKKSQRYKKAHARYMRYWRSVHESSPDPSLSNSFAPDLLGSFSWDPYFGQGDCPPEIKKMGRRASNSVFAQHRIHDVRGSRYMVDPYIFVYCWWRNGRCHRYWVSLYIYILIPTTISDLFCSSYIPTCLCCRQRAQPDPLWSLSVLRGELAFLQTILEYPKAFQHFQIWQASLDDQKGADCQVWTWSCRWHHRKENGRQYRGWTFLICTRSVFYFLQRYCTRSRSRNRTVVLAFNLHYLNLISVATAQVNCVSRKSDLTQRHRPTRTPTLISMLANHQLKSYRMFQVKLHFLMILYIANLISIHR